MNLGAVLVLGALAAKFMDANGNGTTTTVRDVVDIGGTAPPRPNCGFGKTAIYIPTENRWECIIKFG